MKTTPVLAQEIVTDLTRRRGWISLAESCTGGLIAHEITQVPGSSRVFYGGAVVYHPDLKTKIMSVPRFVLHKRGPVSPEVAQSLAKGAVKLARSSLSSGRKKHPLYGLSTTGIAGPGGGTLKTPVGTCWMAVATSGGKLFTKKVQGPPGLSRDAYKKLFAREALELLHLAMKERSG